MDKYTVDLDKVLDEFEQHEDLAEELAAGNEHIPSGYREYLNTTGDVYRDESISTCAQLPKTNHSFYPVTLDRYDYPFEPLEKLNLADADFAPLAKTVLNKSNFEPESNVSNSDLENPSSDSTKSEVKSFPLPLKVPEVKNQPRSDSETIHLPGGSDEGIQKFCAFSPDRKSFEKDVNLVDTVRNLRPERSLDKESKNVDALMGVVYNDTCREKTVNVDLDNTSCCRLPKINNNVRNQVKIGDGDVENGASNGKVDDDELSEVCRGESSEVNELHEKQLSVEIKQETNVNMECSFSSDSYLTPVGFENDVVDDVEIDLDRHLKEAEQELEVEKTESENAQVEVDVTDFPIEVKSGTLTEELSSGNEEFLSPVGENHSTCCTSEKSEEKEDGKVNLENVDGGIHRGIDSVEHSVLEKKPKKKKLKIRPQPEISTQVEIEDDVEEKVIHDAINRELALKTKLPDVHSLKEQQNLEIKQQLENLGEVSISSAAQEEISDEGATSNWSSLPNKRQRPTSLKLPGIVESSDGSNQSSTPAYPPPPNLDFPTPANPTSDYLELATPLVEESSMPVPEEVEYIDLWKGAEMANTPLASPAAAWEDVDACGLQLGTVAPFWIPDSDASSCMQCNCKFTVIKRRHHCRACGLVLCAQCCGARAKLVYLDNKEARVCHLCLQILLKVTTSTTTTTSTTEQTLVPSPSHCPKVASAPSPSNFRPNPNNPIEYCSVIPPLQQAQSNVNNAPPTVLVPVGVLKREGSKAAKMGSEPKQVMFSDGIRPGGDLTELDRPEEPKSLYRRSGRVQKKVEKISDSGCKGDAVVTRLPDLPDQTVHFIPDNDRFLPPVIITSETTGESTVHQTPDPDEINIKLNDPQVASVKFAINKNLFVFVKIVNLDCCVNSTCWCFSTIGMCNVGQEEILVVLECLPEEKTIPLDVFRHFSSIYEEASQGNVIANLGYSIFNQSFLSSRDHGGFLYVRPTFQCLHGLILPPPPYLVGILLQKWEMPWAKVFPIRLMLRLGAEFCYYPCPLVSSRFRKPVFCEIGHTIMNLLADFRNYQYTLPNVRGMAIHMEDKRTRVRFPRNRYDELMKALNNSNDHVLALGSNFSVDADSHLVCVQNEEGSYQTQAINIQNKPRKITGASFVVFNGALKSSSGLTAKSSIVEDGLMIQIPAEKMNELRQSLRDMKDITIECGPINGDQVDEVVVIEWVEDDKNFNIGVKSPIDNLAMDGIQSIRIHGGTDYVGEQWLIRWTEVFLIQTDETLISRRSEPVNISRLSEVLAQAFCVALTGHLDSLQLSGLNRIALRATVDTENVGYEVGSMGAKLPAVYMSNLDSELVPVIHRAASQIQEGPITLELIFHILEQ